MTHRVLPSVDSFVHDVRDAVRAVVKTPSFAIVTVAILAAAIGANSTIFTLVDALFLRDLPVRRPDQLVQVSNTPLNREQRALSIVMFEELERRQQVFTRAILWTGSGVANVETDGRFTLANLWAVDGHFHEELGQRPHIGRLIAPTDADLHLATAAPVVVLGYGFWQQHFGGDPSVVGRQIRIEGEPFTILGVTVRGFGGMGLGEDPDITIPLPAMGTIFRNSNGTPLDVRDRRRQGFSAAGRLKSAIGIDQARAQLEAIWPELLAASVPQDISDAERAAFLAGHVDVRSASKGVEYFLRTRFTQPLAVLMAVAALILVIACVHLASLMLARAASRSHELGLRLALGASRWRVCHQVVIESLLLSTTGAVIGLLFARSTSDWLTAFMTQQYLVVPHFDLRPGTSVISLTAALAIASGVLFSLAPVWFATRQDPASALRTQSRQLQRSTGKLGQALIVAQVALSLVVLIDAGLLAQSVWRLRTIDPGFQREGVLITRLMGRPHGYDGFEPAAYYRDLLDRVRALPGVGSASLSTDRPANASPPRDAVDGRTVFRESISPGFLETLGIPLVAGRDFRWSDDERQQGVGILSRRLAASLFGPIDPIGQRLQLSGNERRPPIEVVGVAEDARLFDMRDTPYIVYLPATQQATPFRQGILEVKASRDAATLPAAVSAAVDSLGREYAQRIRTLDEIVDLGLVPERMTAGLALFVSLLALALACVGLYGLMSYTVALRTREIGIRMALGARPVSVRHAIVADAARMVIIGVAVGVPLSLATADVLASMLFGIGSRDPLTMVSVSAILVAVGGLAAYLPARRASTVDPMVALRCE